MTVSQLRKKHQEFVYERFWVEKKSTKINLTFHFTLKPNDSFYPRLSFPAPKAPINEQSLAVFAFHVGLVEMLSYWKAACPAVITIKAGYLETEQLVWWRQLLIHGLGEFFYQNKIDFRDSTFVNLKVASSHTFPPYTKSLKDRSLVLIGGGKDSLVSLETLKKAHHKTAALLINPTPAAKEISQIAGLSSPITISRTLDPHLLELNKNGYLNGHTPFSALLAFIGCLAAVLYNYRNVVVSNEDSANEGNGLYLGHEINHQYSKTYQFERKVRAYIQKFVSPHLNYYSLVRPLYELQISKLVARSFPQYLPAIKSCNRLQKENKWCCQCPKCLFVYASLYPFLGNKLTTIFGADLYANVSLYPLAEKLVVKDKEKPFECVGTKEETIVAFYLGIKRARKEGQTLPPLLARIQDQLLAKEKRLEEVTKKVLLHWNNHHFLPKTIAKSLSAKITAN